MRTVPAILTSSGDIAGHEKEGRGEREVFRPRPFRVTIRDWLASRRVPLADVRLAGVSSVPFHNLSAQINRSRQVFEGPEITCQQVPEEAAKTLQSLCIFAFFVTIVRVNFTRCTWKRGIYAAEADSLDAHQRCSTLINALGRLNGRILRLTGWTFDWYRCPLFANEGILTTSD